MNKKNFFQVKASEISIDKTGKVIIDNEKFANAVKEYVDQTILLSASPFSIEPEPNLSGCEVNINCDCLPDLPLTGCKLD